MNRHEPYTALTTQAHLKVTLKNPHAISVIVLISSCVEVAIARFETAKKGMSSTASRCPGGRADPHGQRKQNINNTVRLQRWETPAWEVEDILCHEGGVVGQPGRGSLDGRSPSTLRWLICRRRGAPTPEARRVASPMGIDRAHGERKKGYEQGIGKGSITGYVGAKVSSTGSVTIVGSGDTPHLVF